MMKDFLSYVSDRCGMLKPIVMMDSPISFESILKKILVLSSKIILVGLVGLIGLICLSWTSIAPDSLAKMVDPSVAAIVLPAPTPVGGRIAFISDRDANSEIYAIYNDGTGLTRLTDCPYADTQPVWSPDGRYIAFMSTDHDNRDIYVLNPNNGDRKRLTSHPAVDMNPVWSPDGIQIAFVSFRNESDPDGCGFGIKSKPGCNLEVYVVSLVDGHLSRVTDNPAIDWNPAWSPDGTRIAFESSRHNNTDIYIFNANNNRLKRLTEDPAMDTNPVWSPDGIHIAFQRRGEIFTIKSDGSDLKNITNHNGLDYNPVWSPNGQCIAFVSIRQDNPDIYRMNIDGGNLTRLTDHPAWDRQPVWSPDGARIAFSSLRDELDSENCVWPRCNSEIYIMNADGSEQINLSNSSGRDDSPVWGTVKSTSKRIAKYKQP